MSSSHNSMRKDMDAACEDVTTEKAEKKKVTEKESDSSEDQAIHQKTAAADSDIISQSSEHQKQQETVGDPPASSVQDGNADAYSDLVDVGGYIVKAGTAPILQSIFSKYGDIASNCLFKQQNIRSLLSEIFCNIIEMLQSAEFGVSTCEVKEMIAQISDAAKAKLDVSWLQRFLEEMNQVEEVGKGSPGLMELRAISSLIVVAARKDMEDKRMEVMPAEEQFMEAKDRLKAFERVKAKIDNEVEFLAQSMLGERG